jgi:hypothetical protein
MSTTNAPTCDRCGARQAATVLFLHGTQRLCLDCTIRQVPDRVVVTLTYRPCTRCGGAHEASQCDVPEGFRQFGEARPD